MNTLSVKQKPRGTQLFKKGQEANAMYFVIKGEVEVGRDKSYSVSTGAVLGAIDFLNGRLYNNSARCLTDVELLVITEANIITLFKNQPQVAYLILKLVAAKKTGKQVGKVSPRQEIKAKTKPILPEGHPQFDLVAPQSHDAFIFETEVTCPICNHNFSGTRMRESRMVTSNITSEFRTIYNDFEPLWYYIWVCPNCSFAYPHKQFTKVPRRSINRLQSKMTGKQTPSLTFSPRRTLNEVFSSYYLALKTYEAVGALPQQFGNLWMRLVWLYEDANCNQWVDKAAENSLAYFEEALITSERSEAGDQKLYILMAELNLRLGSNNKGLDYLLQAVNLRQGIERYRRQAADKIQDIRSGSGDK